MAKSFFLKKIPPYKITFSCIRNSFFLQIPFHSVVAKSSFNARRDSFLLFPRCCSGEGRDNQFYPTVKQFFFNLSIKPDIQQLQTNKIKNMKIKSVKAIEILDSRGNPTVEADLVLKTDTRARAMVPSGASTGEREAHELRDGDKKRYGGKGVLKAVENVNKIIAGEIEGRCFINQRELDYLMVGMDATANKSKLGANAILSVSMAFARAHGTK